jgi:translation initiation factor 2 subunit 2
MARPSARISVSIVKSFLTSVSFPYAIKDGGMVMTDYRELLKRAQSQLPQERGTGQRFEVPKVRSSVIGMRTIIHNFKEIADALNRDPRHLIKFLTNEMATAGTLEESRATFQGKFPHNTLERLVTIYTESFVVCPVCKRPDTKIVKERRLFFLVCEACGAKSSLKPV